jgi:hypothetical protein
MLSLGEALLANDGLDLGVRAAHRPNLAKIGQMPGSQREAQVEELRLGLASLLLQLFDRKVAKRLKIFSLH